MTPAEFLAVVLPSAGSGLYCAVELTKRKEHFYAETIDEIAAKVEEWHQQQLDCFFAVATFDTKRGTDNAQFVRSFFVDMDGYETKKAAALALTDFLNATGLAELGMPTVVDSGGGLHAYWPLQQEIPANIWKPLAEDFKRLCKQFDFTVDMAVTADTARILRVPGTTNFKRKYATPRPVRIRQVGDTFDLVQFSAKLYEQLADKPSEPEPVLSGKRPKRPPNASQIKMMQNSITLFSKVEEAGCLQLQHYKDHGQQDGMEPLWRGLLSWTKVCADGEDHALSLSAVHPYSEDRMREKLAQIKGPYPCTKMDSENPGVCKGCKHWGKVTNPLVLGREIKTDNTAKVIELKKYEPPPEVTEDFFDSEESYGVDEEEIVTGAALLQPPPPRGYSYGENGGVYVTVAEEDEEGNKSKRQVQLLPYDLFVVDLLKREEEHLVHMVAVRPEGVQTLNFPQKSIVSKDETLKWLATNNVISSFAGYDKQFYSYVRAAVGEASQNRPPIVVPHQFGWQEDNSFVYNNRVFTADGRETVVPLPGLENINRVTNGKGNLKTWRKMWEKIFIQKPDMETALALSVESFGAPLMHFTEFEGFSWHIGSQWSGTGKSLVLSAKAGVWGHPLRYRTGKGTSPVAMQQRAGLLNSLPLLIDEITNKQRNDMEWAPTFIFDFSEAQGKERMESGTNKERINNSTWKTTVTMTGNEKITDYMAGARKYSSNGELLRVLEWSPHNKITFTEDERLWLLELKRNYGVAGEAWVRWLVRNRDTAAQVVQQAWEFLKKEYSFSDDERYWHAGCTVAVAAAILLRKEYANIIDVPVRRIVDALHALVKKGRAIMKQSSRTAEDVLNAYIGEYYGQFVIIKKVENKILAAWGDDGVVDKSITRSKVLGRVEHEMLQPGFREVFLEEQLLRKHCVSMSFGYDEFKAQIEKIYRVAYVKKNMLARTNGPMMTVNTMHISFRNELFDGNTLSVDEAKAR